MKVNISLLGRFHAFDLAFQLQKKNILHVLNTTYPANIVRRWGIDKKFIRTNNFIFEIIIRFNIKYKWFENKKIDAIFKKRQAKSNFKYLDQCDIFIGWSGCSLEAIIEAKKKGKTTILERGSSHYNFQMAMNCSEFKEIGKVYEPDYATWQRELLEYELVDYISIPSSFVKRTFIEQGISESKLLLNPYGVNLEAFKQVEKKDTVFRVLYVGKLSFRKGSHYLLRAFSELNLPNTELCHIGTISQEMESIVKKYSNNNILYLGSKPQNELYKSYSQGSVFVLLSLEEGLAMVQPQAMACGLPLICTTNTGGEDLISKNGEEGFVIPIRDVEALKEKLLYLYNNPVVCKEMGEKAKRRVENSFSWDDYGDRYHKNLERIMNTNKNI